MFFIGAVFKNKKLLGKRRILSFHGEYWKKKGDDNMSIKLGNYYFDGPFNAILDKRGNGIFQVLDIGESANVKTRVENHDRDLCWYFFRQGEIVYAAYYTPHMHQAGRIIIEQELRDMYNPVCGIR